MSDPNPYQATEDLTKWQPLPGKTLPREFTWTLEGLTDTEIGKVLIALQDHRKAVAAQKSADIDWEAANYGWPDEAERAELERMAKAVGAYVTHTFLHILKMLGDKNIEILRTTSYDQITNVTGGPAQFKPGDGEGKPIMAGIPIDRDFYDTLNRLTNDQVRELRALLRDRSALHVDPVEDAFTYKIIHARMIAHLFLSFMQDYPEALESADGRRKPRLCVQNGESSVWTPYLGIDKERIVGEFVEYCQQD